MTQLQLKNGLIATNDGMANFIIKAGNGYMRAYTDTLNPSHYKSQLRTKHFNQLSKDCQNWLLKLELNYTKPHSVAGNEERKSISQFYYELTGTGIYCFSAWDCGIWIDDVREYLCMEGVINAESYFEKFNYLA